MITRLRPADLHGFTATVVAVPLILALLSAIQLEVHQRITEFLVLPPLAVIVYLIFRERDGPSSNFRSIVVLPFLSSIIGQLSVASLGLTPAGAALALFAVLIAQAVLKADMPPALALAMLAMLLHVHGYTYTLGVLEGTLVIFGIFRLWRLWANGTSR
jgi:hypothetical protein